MMKNSLFIFCFTFFAVQAFGQKLPDVQSAALPAPANIRIDGKATEWKDTFAAENKRTEVLYSLANDDKNLYLIIKSTSTANASKIMLGGVTFVVNKEGKKKEKEAVLVTYPLVSRANRNIGQGGNRQGQGQNRQTGGGGQNRTQQTQAQRDSATLVRSKTALATVKEIKIAGIKSIPDSLISIYNEYGIKAVASFDAQGAFIYELALPLQLLEISPADAKEFAYQIKLNGLNMGGFGGGAMIMGRPGGGGGNSGGGGGGNGGAANFQDLMSPTDFWGKYTLIKK
jgi:hypothetical protein